MLFIPYLLPSPRGEKMRKGKKRGRG